MGLKAKPAFSRKRGRWELHPIWGAQNWGGGCAQWISYPRQGQEGRILGKFFPTSDDCLWGTGRTWFFVTIFQANNHINFASKAFWVLLSGLLRPYKEGPKPIFTRNHGYFNDCGLSTEHRTLREVLGWSARLTFSLQTKCLWQGHIMEDSPLSDSVKGRKKWSWTVLTFKLSWRQCPKEAAWTLLYFSIALNNSNWKP